VVGDKKDNLEKKVLIYVNTGILPFHYNIMTTAPIIQTTRDPSMARDDPPASSTAAAMRGKVGSEFET